MARAAKPKPKPKPGRPPTRTSCWRSTAHMLLIRRFEERAGQLYGMGLIGGFCHLYIGQEAIAVGVQSVKQPGDQVITGYRDHGHMLAAGMDPKAVMAELTGRAAGASKGKGGSMHMFSTEHALLRRPRHRRRPGQPRHRPGARQPLPRQQGGRLRLLRRRRGQPGPGLRELQHGRALEPAGRLRHREQPVRHGHLDRALVVGDPPLSSAAPASTSRARRSTAWTCWRCARPPPKAAEHARSGKGPFILEMKTYRYRGHSMSDPAKYRTREEIDEVRKTPRPDRPRRGAAARRRAWPTRPR